MLNSIMNVTAQEGCSALPSNFSGLQLTSPPYEDMFEYAGHWQRSTGRELAPELYRIARPGSVLAWMVRDQIVDGKQSGESLLQVLALIDVGFWWFDTIFAESGYLPGPTEHYFRTTTPVYIMTKGKRDSRDNTLICDVPVDSKNDVRGMGYRQASGKQIRTRPLNTYDYRIRGQTWYYPAGGHKTCSENYLSDFPAKMPELLAEDLIFSFSHKYDVVFDPFAGVMTSAKMALLNGRRYVAFEPDEWAFNLGARRLRETHDKVNLQASQRLRRSIAKHETWKARSHGKP
jgi:hypothetical protein